MRRTSFGDETGVDDAAAGSPKAAVVAAAEQKHQRKQSSCFINHHLANSKVKIWDLSKCCHNRMQPGAAMPSSVSVATAEIVAQQSQDYVDEQLAEYQNQIQKLQGKISRKCFLFESLQILPQCLDWMKSDRLAWELGMGGYNRFQIMTTQKF